MTPYRTTRSNEQHPYIGCGAAVLGGCLVVWFATQRDDLTKRRTTAVAGWLVASLLFNAINYLANNDPNVVVQALAAGLVNAQFGLLQQV